ncbi:MAG: FG-GAP-like repeat-containing protein [Flavobacteriales bacterium]
MKQNFTTFLTFIACLFTLSAFSQTISFTNESNLLQSVSGSSYEDCVVDVNIDGYDDVVRVTDAGLYIDYQNADGSGFTPFFYATSWNRPPSWSLAAGDLNGDGYRDFCFGNGQRVSFVLSSDNGSVWTEETFPEYIFSQRNSMIDLDLDGDLDAFVCHDVDQSHMYINDGSGNMTLDIDAFPTYEDRGNYANMWVDYDNDGDTDFYLTKCSGPNSPFHPNVINRMYRNNGDGTFTEVGEETNTADPQQSWTTVFEDFDNDGDFDLFTVNHTDKNSLQWNNGDGTFSDNAVDGTGIDEDDLGAWELDAHDFNNDGFVDIITEHGTPLYYNNGDGTFTGAALGFNDGAFGDLNNDGFLDAVRGNTLYMNSGNENNYVRVDLDGIISNSDGIGARVSVATSDGMTQIREVRCGRSFSPMSNLAANFGIGSNTTVENITVSWPSGVITVLENPEINTAHIIPEAECLAGNIEITTSGSTQICPGESLEIMAPAGGASYSWSNGADGSSIQVTQSGTYSVAMYNADNCVATSNSILVEVIEEEIPEISVQGPTLFCEGGSVILTSTDAESYQWSNDGTTQSIEVTESGTYNVTTEGICFDASSESIEVAVLAAAMPDAPDVSAGPGSEVTLTATADGIVTWYEDEDLTTELGTGTSFTVPGFTLDEQTSFWATSTTEYPGELQDGGKLDLGDESDYGLPSTGGYCLFNVTEDFTLLAVTVYADGSGDRTFNLTNAAEEIIETVTINLMDGENEVNFNWLITEGTDWSIRSPQNDMFRNDGSVSYPYPIGDVGSIYTSNFGGTWYYYFYDWKIQKESFNCESAPVEVIASVVGVEEIEGAFGLEMFPNPAVDVLTVNFNSNNVTKLNLDVLNALGQVVISQEVTANGSTDQRVELNVNNLEAGVYTVRINGDKSEISQSFVKK